MYFQKVISRKTFFSNQFFVGILKLNDENSRIRFRGMDPRIPNVTDPQHWLILRQSVEDIFQQKTSARGAEQYAKIYTFFIRFPHLISKVRSLLLKPADKKTFANMETQKDSLTGDQKRLFYLEIKKDSTLLPGDQNRLSYLDIRMILWRS